MNPTLKIAFIDHYDSFSFNLIEWLASDSNNVSVERVCYDDKHALAKLEEFPVPTVISPGPKRPEDVPSTLSYLGKVWGRVPLLGVCLGHQALCYSQGFTITKASSPHHGAMRTLSFESSDPLFEGFTELKAVTYNSLKAEAPHGGDQSGYQVLATDQWGDIQAIRFLNSDFPTYGLQFHPEAHLTESGELLAKNWLNLIRPRT